MTRKLGTIKKLLLTASVTSGAVFLFNTGTAFANHVIPPPGTMPNGYRSGFGPCGHTNESPCLVSWISAPGARTSQTVNVAYGQASVQLDFNFFGIVSYPNSDVHETRVQIVGASATPAGTVSGINGVTLGLNFDPNYQRVGYNRQTARRFTYAPNGGFTTSGTYVIHLPYKAQNRFSNRYGCVVSGGNYSTWNIPPCFVTNASFAIYINVAPRPVDAGTCGVSAPTIVYPGESFNASFSARNTGTNGGFPWPVNNGQPARYRLREQGTWPGAGEMEIQGSGVTPTGFGPILYPGDATNWPPPAIAAFTAPTTPGSYTFSWRIYGNNNLDGYHYVGSPCAITIQVVERPYHKVYGGDVLAGGGFGSPCYDTDARIIGFNAPNYAFFGLSVGSGTQLAALALGTIDEFGSGQARNSASPATINVKNLTFANTTPGYGGELGDGNAVCAPDFWANATGVQTGNITIGNTNLGLGQRVTRYIEGNVRITGNITQANGAFNDITRVPSYRLIVRGNIYIAPGVSELNGLFVAIPTNATNGRIYTCSDGNFGPPAPAQVAGGTCQNQLTVYGAAVADLIKFSRSGGSLRNACPEERFNVNCPSGQLPAERFIYTPETWLTSDFTTDNTDFDSIRTLPPIL